MHFAEYVPWVLEIMKGGAADADNFGMVDLRKIPRDGHEGCRLVTALMVGQCLVASAGFTAEDVMEAEGALVAEMVAARVTTASGEDRKEG